MTKGAMLKKRWIGVALLLGAAIVAWAIVRVARDEAPGTASVGVEGATRPATPVSPMTPDLGDDGAPTDEGLADGFDPNADQDMIALRWAQVDLDALREEMPDNLYWRLGAPTSDPDVERERAEERARWNEAYGKVLSGTATVDEIHAYYDQRAQISTDYLEFASRVLEDYGKLLPPRDVGLLELSVKMHHARLQSMPRRLTEALERKTRQDRLREAWLADEEAFERAQAEEVERSLR